VAKRFRPLVPLVLVVLLGACDWAQFGFDAGHSGFDPSEPAITVDNVATLTPRWTAPLRDPVVAGGTVFGHTAMLNGVEAVDASTGAVRWHVDFGLDDASPPAVSGGVVYVVTNHFSLTAPTSALHGFDARTGTPRFTSGLVDCPSAATSVGPTVGAGIVVVAGNRVCALDPATGDKVWSAAVPVDGAVALAGGRLFAAGFTAPSAGTVTGLDATDGTVDWSRSVGWVPRGTPVAAGGRLYLGDGGLDQATFDAATGAPGPTLPVDVISVGGGSIVGIANDTIEAVDVSSGAVRWSITGPRGTEYSTPAIANGLVYVGSDQDISTNGFGDSCCAHMSALRLDTGGQAFSFTTQRVPHEFDPTSVIVGNGTVYVDTENVGVTAFRPAGS
jgi:outer membrane protein assembly factor BamB